jgi:Tfp pilus assembly protein FimT
MATTAVHPFEAPIMISTMELMSMLAARYTMSRARHRSSVAVNGADRRQAWRYPAHLGVSLDSGTGVSRDVSASGIYFETDAALSPGETIAFSFSLEHIYPDVRLDLHCRGKIARVEQRGGQLGVAATIEAWSFEPPSSAGGRAGYKGGDGRMRTGKASTFVSALIGRHRGNVVSLQRAIRRVVGLASRARDRGRWATPSMLPRQAGMTAVELLIDVSVLATLGLVAVAWTGNYFESGRARTAAEQVAGVLQQARQYAIANAAIYTVTLTGGTVAVTCTGGCPLNPPPPSEPATPIMNGATTSVPSPPITFDSLGAATAGTVTITYPGATQWQVSVSAAGRVRACSPTCP